MKAFLAPDTTFLFRAGWYLTGEHGGGGPGGGGGGGGGGGMASRLFIFPCHRKLCIGCAAKSLRK